MSLARVCAVLTLACAVAGSAAAQPVPQLIDISPGAGASSPGPMVVIGDVAYFAATDPIHGRELWRSDGTPGGTYLLADILPGAGSSSPTFLVAAGNRLFFAAYESTHGQELWKSDGTAAGTQMVIDVIPGPQSSYPRNPVASGNDIFLQLCENAHGCEIWKSDGTAAGSMMIKDIRVGAPSSFPNYLAVLGVQVLFAANDGVTGEELWRSNGTAAGTVLVKNIDPTPLVSESDGRGRSYPSALTTIGNSVLFVARNEIQGRELWKSDGTLAGTVIVREFMPGLDDSLFDSTLLLVGNQLFFLCRTGTTYPANQWRTCVSDGTFAGTTAGAVGLAGNIDRAKLGGFFYYQGAGIEPWKSDLTVEGSALLLEIAPGSAFSSPSGFRTAGNHVYFSANNQVNGVELWRTDGTAAGTVLVSDINAGAASAAPSPVTQAGDYVLFTATDGANGVELWSIQLNRAPVADAGADQTIAEAAAADLDGSASSDPDSDPLTYEWRDEHDVLLGSDETISVSLPNGIHDITLTVSDGEMSATDTVRVRVGNLLPVAAAGGPYNGVRNTAVVFDGGSSSDPDGDGLTYTWDFGDGATGTGVTPAHAYTAVGSFTVTLVVHDSTADSAPVTSTVTIANLAPAAHAGGPYNGVRNTAVVFDGGGSADPDGDGLTYTWNFGDGATGTGVTPAHAYPTVGSFTVTLVVHDGTADSAPVTSTVTIANLAPAAHAGGPYSGTRLAAIAFNGGGSSDPEGDGLTYTWDFGDGATGTGVTPAHAYPTVGSFTVTLVVHDGTADSASVTSTVTIANLAPAAHAGGPYSGTRLAAIAFNGGGSSDPEGDGLAYAWDFGDGATGTGVAPTHLYATVGGFTVTLTVNDGTVNSTPVVTAVQITNLAPSVSLTSPGAGSVFAAPANVTVAASASDPEGFVSKVEFYADAAKIGEALSAPYTMAWSGASPGSYSLTAVVTDGSGAAVTSAPVPVSVNNPPTVALTAPANNAQYAALAAITLTASAADADGGVTQVEFFRGTTSLGVDASSPYSVTWTGATTGVYVLTAVATDNRGAVVTSAGVTVRVTAALAPTADAYVRASQGSSNFGTATTVTVQQGSSSGNQRWTYLKFNLASLPTISNAKLRVFGGVSATTGTTIQTAVYPVNNTTWTETGLTWNNKPASGTTALATVTIVNNSTTARWYELDVTAYLQAEKAAGRTVVTLVLKNRASSTPYVTLSSKEATTVANRPQVLVVP